MVERRCALPAHEVLGAFQIGYGAPRFRDRVQHDVVARKRRRDAIVFQHVEFVDAGRRTIDQEVDGHVDLPITRRTEHQQAAGFVRCDVRKDALTRERAFLMLDRCRQLAFDLQQFVQPKVCGDRVRFHADCRF
jgi:hypothetical protein